jgi:maltose alpha-D-glucosyltransferase/alpha-amylase
MFHTVAVEDREAFLKIIDASVTPKIPESCQWFVFLRCHDEFTLETVSQEERQFLFEHYCRDELWCYRNGEGIAARLINMLDHDLRKIEMVS